mmetsp:Transcript_40154/g.94397  ORF Transcript_40154/g.94397 Transcript_40154/m.94397 type:complete len:118 (-) Transcript_40154:502-855(-)|eukprot:CAMPEP_0113316380 /NCGR_PEP_ID=MMETSP0010_2-20120614/11678_1 /TAXON_ID=216773 ORGANISM="Corethron hystrix, Strain 308" /NCGR_SAMPLE_ID=MMETSP0010_2 /ASSEMBLY_ACC=CAM_ASM_000155 /LENGTH=117 /DNA_ID=CAMNT_0000173083 /DNA_START=20 /DNA_END=373 /DNA_ORIENTATION=+ /assembly_acc=CAM_ASM_000155
MTKSIIILTFILGLLIPRTINSFVIPPTLSTSVSTTSPIALRAFWSRKSEKTDQEAKKKQAPLKKNKKNTEPPKDSPPGQFVMMFGKPQFDWVKGKPMKTNPRRMNWLVKPQTNDKK